VQSIYKLKGKLQHYSWGGYDFIPNLLHTCNENASPVAEYWLGAHPAHSSTLETEGESISLFDFIEGNKEKVLGKQAPERFDGLPFLFKVLDVRQMLSIQVHPSKQAAEAGFEKEDSLDIDRSAPNRNYKDRNSKPEQMIALGDFWLLHGFKPESDLKNILLSIPEFQPLYDVFIQSGYQGLYQTVMRYSEDEVSEILNPLGERINKLYKENKLEKNDENFWAARAIETFCKNGVYDRGIFSIYFLNLVYLKKGQGIFQPAGLPHAYLEGQNVEVMANSDNVLRAGLTDKHIDVEELMHHVDFVPTHPNVLNAVNDAGLYQAPVSEFALYQHTMSCSDARIVTGSAEIIFIYEGGLAIKGNEETFYGAQGDSFFIVTGTHALLAVETNCTFFRVSVPAL
jgi:mannose-6-phosphate isomerase